MNGDIKAGEVLQFSYPFVRDTYSEMDEGGVSESPTWKPGVRFVERGGDRDPEAVADGIGQQIISVVSTHRPGNFPERVFYTRKWRDPSGKVFGKGSLRVMSAAGLRSLIRGYRHPFEIVPAELKRMVTHMPKISLKMATNVATEETKKGT
jgi:hypothetical protein